MLAALFESGTYAVQADVTSFDKRLSLKGRVEIQPFTDDDIAEGVEQAGIGEGGEVWRFGGRRCAGGLFASLPGRQYASFTYSLSVFESRSNRRKSFRKFRAVRAGSSRSRFPA